MAMNSQTLRSSIGQLLRRCHRWLGGDFDYRAAYSKADLERSYWKIIGADTKEEFEALGRAKLKLLGDLGLTPEGRVLDVGCGTGALTETLMDYLGPRGVYYGTDVAQEAITFCEQKYRRPNFHFRRNELTRLPIEGLQFDFIYFGSVFTHVYPAEMRTLLVEVSRLLDPHGQIVADLFIDPGVHRFRGDRGMVVSHEGYLREMFAATGLWHEVIGSWPCLPELHHAYRRWPCGPQTRRLTYRFGHGSASAVSRRAVG
jgi:ubiquinone/menaquinone biosynthesis C-methylase UbiE